MEIALRVMMNLLTPIVTVVMALGVGFLLLCIFLPLFKLISNISESK
jgi:type II secretory pathway component PulF